MAVGAVPENKKDESEDVPGGCMLDMYNKIYAMRKELERLKRPHGTKDNPARTCRDLHFGHPQFKDGSFFTQNLLIFDLILHFRLVLDRS
jgi:hypothetical protein